MNTVVRLDSYRAAPPVSAERGFADPAGPDDGVYPAMLRSSRQGLAGLRLTRRGRVLVWVLALLVVATLSFSGGRALASTESSVTQTETVRVETGQTLWDFAAELAEPGEDVRDLVVLLKDLNGMGSARLIAGQSLELPVR